MNTESDKVPWEDIESEASKMFDTSPLSGELEWVKECWQHLDEAGLTGNATILEETVTYLRLATLAQICEEFSGCIWDDNPETPLSYYSEVLQIDPLALGILAATANPEAFNCVTEDYDYHDAALDTVTAQLRPEIFACLCKAYGDKVTLYSRMAKTYPSSDEGSTDEFDVTSHNTRALKYVMNGFREG